MHENEVKILHIADTHLGSAFDGLSYEMAELRRKEAAYTFIKSIENAQDCDVLLLSGDIFDSGDIPLSYADSFLSAIESLNDVKVFFSCGNHDSYYTNIIKYCIENSPENLHIFKPDTISYVTLENKKTRIYGASFSSEHCYESMMRFLKVCDDEYINILCIHGDVSSDTYNHINPAILGDFGFDYAALGHIHSFDGFFKNGKCTYAYAGITEGRGFDECGKKGYIKGSVGKKQNNLNFIDASKRKYIDEKIDISDFKSEYELLDVLNSLSKGDNNICRFTFVGENNLNLPVNINHISKQCTAYSVKCIDQSRLNVKVADYISDSGLKGLCAKETQKLISLAKNENEKEKYKKAFSLLIDLFENRH